MSAERAIVAKCFLLSDSIVSTSISMPSGIIALL